MQHTSVKQQGLYHPDEFKDNCGFGLIAHMHGDQSHDLLKKAIYSLTCMTHRGGIAADGKTGDGCGLLLQMPVSFFQNILVKDFGEQSHRVFGVGMVFLPDADPKLSEAKSLLEKECLAQGLRVVGWRQVPIDSGVCGDIAAKQLPSIQQIFVLGHDTDDHAALNRKLYMVRRRAELSWSGEDFYVVSFSSTVVGYKGLVMPGDLPTFYPDLGDPELKTSICVFHQRFSTNTLPKWHLAQPFRFLAHNGEINTIMGNRNWAQARAGKLRTPYLPELDSVTPLVNSEGSDSSSLDNMLEVMLLGGVDLFRAARMLIPPAWQNLDTMDPKLRAFYDYNSMHVEPWDGPAGIVLSDGRYAVCLLDRNGLRPARWVITSDDLITVASEVGTHEYAPETVIAKGRVGPGQILAVDTQTGELLHTQEIDNRLKLRQPYGRWLKSKAKRLKSRFVEQHLSWDQPSEEALKCLQKLFQVTIEEREQVLRPMAENGQEAVGSMGDDTPIAVLSHHIRPLSDFFRQQFAQVTNPPIDPLRETVVMSLETCIGTEKNFFEETPEHANRIILRSPILSNSKFKQLLDFHGQGFPAEKLSLYFEPEIGLQAAIEQLCQQAKAAVSSGVVMLVISDRELKKDQLLIPAVMATGAVHHYLTEQGLRCDCNLIVETATARDPHQFAILVGFGATAIYPYLAYQLIVDMVSKGEVLNALADAQKQYRKSIAKGLLKILSKMGISTIASYRGAQLFEIVGLNEKVVNLCFKGAVSRISGADFSDIQADQTRLSQLAWSNRKPLSAGGLLKYVHDAEYHAYNPDVIQSLHKAVRTGKFEDYLEYSGIVMDRGIAHLRDLFEVRSPLAPIEVDEVEPIEKILSRFDSAGMSLGALSPEAHEAIAQAMNEMGARSNSGEGGEDPARFNTIKNSKIKQVASGRFGVTPHYLVSAEVLQIKIAQGAKPGEGGQLPGGKANALIARLRFSVPGVTLISPPPHHDIYSIEDLAQLIFDLKRVNPEAMVSVKLVSEPGVGTIAAGVAKAYADLITISGYDGGTAASPLSSIRYAGSPWELGLSEAHQALRANDLRARVRLQTDGGLKHGLDVIKAAMFGAESFGFGTGPMVALGCKYLRICHLNNCATGVATQQDELREHHFIGVAQMVKNYFKFIAEDTRQWLARLGFQSLEQVIGRTDLLHQLEGLTPKQQKLCLTPLLHNDHIHKDKPHVCAGERNMPFDHAVLSEEILSSVLSSVENQSGGEFDFVISNCDRSIGARLSGEIAKRYGNQGMAKTPLTLRFKGTAGQSFGVWNAGGLHLHLVGDANDYVGKGMTGGEIVLKPPVRSQFDPSKTSIMGNTCLYGATGGKLFASGCAGERFAVRNSGAIAIVEGVGDHCCEYMTGGVVVVLGRTGYNFGAGMTGGFAYVLDQENLFVDRYNRELIDIQRITSSDMEEYYSYLTDLLSEFVAQTYSEWGREILENIEEYIGRFWLITPKAASAERLLRHIRSRPE